MKISSNIIKIIVLVGIPNTLLFSDIRGLDIPCPGCNSFYNSKIVVAANEINKRHAKLEKKVAKKYNSDIIPLLKTITKIQKEMAHVVVHIAELERQANVDDKKLLFLLRQDKELNTLGTGVK
jgi:hypothetical protein